MHRDWLVASYARRRSAVKVTGRLKEAPLVAFVAPGVGEVEVESEACNPHEGGDAGRRGVQPIRKVVGAGADVHWRADWHDPAP